MARIKVDACVILIGQATKGLSDDAGSIFRTFQGVVAWEVSLFDTHQRCWCFLRQKMTWLDWLGRSTKCL